MSDTEQDIREYEFHGDRIPESSVGALARYIDSGIPPGSFLTHMLEHNVYEAAGYADHLNITRLHVYISFMHSQMPGSSHGSWDNVSDHMARMQEVRKEADTQ